MSKTDLGKRILLNRREALVLSAAAGVGAAFAKQASGLDSTKAAAHQEPGNCSTPRTAVANTQYGMVRGFADGGVITFKGIPYGQTTGGENRWLPAKAPTPWKDEFPALIYGANCPQNAARLYGDRAVVFAGLGRWVPRRGHAEAKRVDAESDGEARGDGVSAWRRIRLRIGL